MFPIPALQQNDQSGILPLPEWKLISVFVGSGIFKSDDPEARAKSIVEATTHYKDADRVAAASTGLKKAMKGLEMSEIPEEERLQERGW